MFWKKCNVVKKFRVCSTLHSKNNVVMINLWLFLQAYMISNTYSHGQKRWNPDNRITTVAISFFDHNCIFLALLVSWFNKWGRRVLVPKHTVIHIASLEISWESWPLDGIVLSNTLYQTTQERVLFFLQTWLERGNHQHLWAQVYSITFTIMWFKKST